jgi:citrate/tricarballylate utilization protein
MSGGIGNESAAAKLSLSPEETEAARVMQICNACRYCEGFCAVFPAMTRRLAFAKDDLHYLANLCHSCGACLHACQYAPPHDFGVNVPIAMARVRRKTYSHYAWPSFLGVLYRRNGLAVAGALTFALAFFLALPLLLSGSLWASVPDGNFYAVLSHGMMISLFGPVFLFAVLALGIGAYRFWRQQEAGPVVPSALRETTSNVLSLKYLDGGHGEGCNNEDDRFVQSRRILHHLTFYGFMLCFAATSVATIYHYFLQYSAPYPFLSAPKLLGTFGGVGLLAGTGGLFWLNRRRYPLHKDGEQQPMDIGFLFLLFLIALTGLLLMMLRLTPAMPLLLSLHLGSVMALFATLPYGKFAHATYRVCALLKWAIEKRKPSPVSLSDE